MVPASFQIYHWVVLAIFGAFFCGSFLWIWADIQETSKKHSKGMQDIRDAYTANLDKIQNETLAELEDMLAKLRVKNIESFCNYLEAFARNNAAGVLTAADVLEYVKSYRMAVLNLKLGRDVPEVEVRKSSLN